MQNLLDRLETEQKRQLNRQSANEQLCHHFAGNAELPKKEIQALSEQYGLACDNFCFDEKKQIEGFNELPRSKLTGYRNPLGLKQA